MTEQLVHQVLLEKLAIFYSSSFSLSFPTGLVCTATNLDFITGQKTPFESKILKLAKIRLFQNEISTEMWETCQEVKTSIED